MQQDRVKLAICVCTVNRPEVLRRCLASIVAGRERPDEILVSDDSVDGSESRAVCEQFPGVRYFVGPRRGLCANRNSVIRVASAKFVSLLDDDAVVSMEFVHEAKTLAATIGDDIILTGAIVEDGRTIVAGNPSFLGYFTKDVNGNYRNVNLNCNVFPREAFRRAAFDEKIGYGYEDMDLCSRLLSLGFQIRFSAALTNMHMPPPKPVGELRTRAAQAQRARFYTSVKRYMLWEKDWRRLVAFAIVAPVHRALHALKRRNIRDLPNCVLDMVFALTAAFSQRSLARQPRTPR